MRMLRARLKRFLSVCYPMVFFLLVLSACAPADPASPPATTATSDPIQETLPVPTTLPIQETPVPDTPASTPLDPSLRPLADQARQDLAGRLGVSPDQIEVLAVQAVVWPDASLGCPQPGMMYAQVPQDGVLVRLVYEGTGYEYHGGGKRGLFLCEQPPEGSKFTPFPGEELIPPPSLEQ